MIAPQHKWERNDYVSMETFAAPPLDLGDENPLWIYSKVVSLWWHMGSDRCFALDELSEFLHNMILWLASLCFDYRSCACFCSYCYVCHSAPTTHPFLTRKGLRQRASHTQSRVYHQKFPFVPPPFLMMFPISSVLPHSALPLPGSYGSRNFTWTCLCVCVSKEPAGLKYPV